MGNIKVVITDMVRGNKFQVVVPGNVPIGELIPALVKKLGLSTGDPGEGTINYRLRVGGGNSYQLNEDSTLEEAGVKDGDTLDIFPQMTAGCFLSSTKILLPDHTRLPIKHLKTGDMVLSFDIEARKSCTSLVEKVTESFVDSYLVINDILKITGTHLVYSKNRWLSAYELKCGDSLQTYKNEDLQIDKIELKKEDEKVYNLQLSPMTHNFFAEGILVHNQNEKAAYAIRERESRTPDVLEISDNTQSTLFDIEQLRPFIGEKTMGQIGVDQESCVIRFDISGQWPVRKFTEFLNTIDLVYRRLNAFLFFSEDFDEKIHRIIKSKSTNANDQDLIDLIISTANRHSPALRINRLKMASPGFAELIGNLNPLKVIADFITAWRHENTLREQNLRQTELDRLKVKSEIAKLILERSAELSKQGLNDYFINKFVHFALDESQDMLEDISKDIRLQEVSLPTE